MSGRSKRKLSFFHWRLCLQTSGIYRFPAIPGRYCQPAGRSDIRPSWSGPGVSAQVASLQSLIPAPVSTSVEEEFVLEKLVVVVDREK